MKYEDAQVGDRLILPVVPDQPMRVVRKENNMISLDRIGKADRMPSNFYSAEFDAIGFEKIDEPVPVGSHCRA